MKLSYTTADGRLTVELDGNSDKELFRKLAKFQEVFEDSMENVTYKVRKSKYTDDKGKEKEAEYFEKQISSGKMQWYKKSYGVLDDGTDNLFPKKAPDAPNIIKGENGWHKFNLDKKESADVF